MGLLIEGKIPEVKDDVGAIWPWWWRVPKRALITMMNGVLNDVVWFGTYTMYNIPCDCPTYHALLKGEVHHRSSVKVKKHSNGSNKAISYLYLCILAVDRRVFSWGGLGGSPPSGKNFANPPPSDTCPHFWTKACPPQPRLVPENLKNLNTFLCQIWLLFSSKVP